MTASEAVCPADLLDAQKHWPRATEADLAPFAARQLEARRRVRRLLDFYTRHPCRLSRIHLLTASSVAIARFCGFSPSFHAIGEAIMPVDENGAAKNELWRRYQGACEENRPWPVRDELWLEAHAANWQVLKEQGLDAAFNAEAAAHAGDPAWRLIRKHAELTLGTRVFDHLSTEGRLPHETTISFAIALFLKRAVGLGGPLFRHVLGRAIGAVLFAPPEGRDGVAGYRLIGATVLKSAARAPGLWKVYRRGLRIKARGVRCPEVSWPVLETLLESEVERVHPLIVEFYRNPEHFSGTVSLDIRTLPLMIYSRLAALLVGQGLYEGDSNRFPARMRVFQRDDGSMHFVRELYCNSTLRVFDSDFVLRTVGDKPALVEVFGDIGVDVVLDAELRSDRGVAVVGRDIYWRGLRLPRTALRIEFASRVVGEAGDESIEVLGTLNMQPQTALGRFVMHTLLRRPNELGSIRYELRAGDEAGG